MYGISQHTIRKWKKEEDWDAERDKTRQVTLFLKNSSQEQKLEAASDHLSSLVFMMTQEGLDEWKESSALPRNFNLKALTDAIDKLARLKMHVASGGVQKTANVNINLTDGLVQQVVMEVLIELEKRYPQINSKDLVRDLFNGKLKAVLAKFK